MHQHYLCFALNTQHYQFVALPFSGSTAPRVFTWVLNPMLVLFGSNGVLIVDYFKKIISVITLICAHGQSLILKHNGSDMYPFTHVTTVQNIHVCHPKVVVFHKHN